MDQQMRYRGITTRKKPALVAVPPIESDWLRWVFQDERERYWTEIRCLVVPVTIDVYADGPIDQEEMAWFLTQNCFVSVNRLGTGEGPGHSVVLALVDWKKLKVVKG